MTSPSVDNPNLQPREVADYGFARARDIAFDAVSALWRKRRAEGMKQIQLAKSIGRDSGWVSRNLRGPGNWTLRTLGELVEGLDGELTITVYPLESAPSRRDNYSAYHDFNIASPSPTPKGVDAGAQIFGGSSRSPVLLARD